MKNACVVVTLSGIRHFQVYAVLSTGGIIGGRTLGGDIDAIAIKRKESGKDGCVGVLVQRLQGNGSELDGGAFALQSDMAFVRHVGGGFVLELAVDVEFNFFSSARDFVAVPLAGRFLAVGILTWKEAELIAFLRVLD